MQARSTLPGHAGAFNFAVGCIFIIDMFTRFHSPIRLVSGYASIMINQPRAIARFYLTRCAPRSPLLATGFSGCVSASEHDKQPAARL